MTKKQSLMSSLPHSMSNELMIYYERVTLETITERLYKKLKKQARELAEEIVASYDFKQYFSAKLEDKIIITSVLTKKTKTPSR